MASRQRRKNKHSFSLMFSSSSSVPLSVKKRCVSLTMRRGRAAAMAPRTERVSNPAKNGRRRGKEKQGKTTGATRTIRCAPLAFFFRRRRCERVFFFQRKKTPRSNSPLFPSFYSQKETKTTFALETSTATILISTPPPSARPRTCPPRPRQTG